MSMPLPKHEIGIVAALAPEVAGFAGRRAGAAGIDGVQVGVSGIGRERAAAASRALVEQGARLLVSWGTAGALAPGLAAGDLLVPRSVVAEGHEWMADAAWREWFGRTLASGLPVAAGRLWCGGAAVVSVPEKARLAARDLAAADMESAAVATVAGDAGVAFVAVKAICDPADRGIPGAALRLIGADGRLASRDLPGGLRDLLCAGPAAWRNLLALRSDFARARHTLRRAALVLSR